MSATPLSPGCATGRLVRSLRKSTPSPRPILLSNLDVVVQGFLREFGAEG